ncbi:MAG: hypothetical protein ABUL50_05425, partial [Rhizobacter sp.]
QRVRMGEKIGDNLALLVQHPQLSLGFRQVLLGLQTRWEAMRACSGDADRECAPDRQLPAHARLTAPDRLQ